MRPHSTVTGTGSQVTGQSHTWDKRVATWDHSALPGFDRIVQTVLRHADSLKGLDVVDLGSGSGDLTLELAKEAGSVLAVDFSAGMLARLEQRAAEMQLCNVRTVHSTIQSLDLPEHSVDVIISNYALHHLRHPEKREILARAAKWLRPGGRIVIGDMMFSVAGNQADRRIIADKVVSIARRGPAGWWRIAKNVWRFLVARQECPASMEAWTSMLGAAGFVGVSSERVVAEGAVVSGRLPEQ